MNTSWELDDDNKKARRERWDGKLEAIVFFGAVLELKDVTTSQHGVKVPVLTCMRQERTAYTRVKLEMGKAARARAARWKVSRKRFVVYF